MGSPIIEFEDVSVRYRVARGPSRSLKEYAIRRLHGRGGYDDRWALRGVSLEVYQGEMIGVIGANGAGKSTLLKLVAQVLSPTAGRVRVRGLVAPILGLGAGFDPELTGRENVFLGGAVLGVSRADIAMRFRRIVDFADLTECIDLPLRTYSTGMVARLGFAVATDVDANILLLDEVLSAGDGEFRARAEDRIQSLCKRMDAVLIASHSMEEVLRTCHRVAWLDHGVLRALGSRHDVVAQYQSSWH
jgi:ABC-2 type transport system ATP-binding protein/lipopolysaccharide transport system ATP-binding protein